MTVRGTNHAARKARLTTAYLAAHDHLQYYRAVGDAAGVKRWNERMRLARLAWQRLDDHLFPKAGAR